MQSSSQRRRPSVTGCKTYTSSAKKTGNEKRKLNIPHPVGYLAPWRCKTCTPLISHSGGGSAPSSIPNAPRGTLYQGDKLPQERKRLNGRSLGVEGLDGGSGNVAYAGATSWAAPVWRGWLGAVAMMPGSAPVGVSPGYPTLTSR